MKKKSFNFDFTELHRIKKILYYILFFVMLPEIFTFSFFFSFVFILSVQKQKPQFKTEDANKQNKKVNEESARWCSGTII